MNRYTFVYLAAVMGLAGSGYAEQGGSIDRTAAARAPASAPASRPAAAAELIDLNPGPVVQFEETCARCHGPQGSFYGEGFGHLEPAELEAMVLQMMEGPAGLSPTRKQLAAMVAYHAALREAAPFVVITNAKAFAAGRDRYLRGEVTPETTVEIRKGGQVVRAAVVDLAWTVPEAPRAPFAVAARKEGKQTAVAFPAQQWSVPLPASKSQ